MYVSKFRIVELRLSNLTDHQHLEYTNILNKCDFMHRKGQSKHGTKKEATQAMPKSANGRGEADIPDSEGDHLPESTYTVRRSKQVHLALNSTGNCPSTADQQKLLGIWTALLISVVTMSHYLAYLNTYKLASCHSI